MVASHTPGPWHLVAETRGNGNDVRGNRDGKLWARGSRIFLVCGPAGAPVITRRGIGSPTTPKGEANARLIAAAPDLLEALKAVDRQVFCDCPEHSHCITHEPGCFIPILRAALAKATGDAS